MPEEDRQSADAPRYATLQDYLRVFGERWKLIAAFTVVFGIAAFAYSASQEKRYEAQATLNTNQRSADIGLIGSTSGPPANPQALTTELAAMAERDSIAKAVERSLDTSLSEEQIASAVSASVDPQTNLVLLSGTSTDPELAAQMTNEYAEHVLSEAQRSEREEINSALKLVRRQLQDAKRSANGVITNEVAILQERFNRLQTLKQISDPVEIVTAATAPSEPISPKPARNLMLGILAGLFLGIVAAFIRDSLDTRLKTPREIEEHFRLARIGQLTDSAFGRSVVGSNGRQPLDAVDLEAARIMRTNLDFLDPDRPLRSLIVTSPLPGEGKSTVAVALAWAAAMSGKLTLLVECDLRQPVLAERLRLQSSPGLTEVFLGAAAPRDVLQPVDVGAGTGNGAGAGGGQLVCITAGRLTPSPAELLASKSFAEFLEQVKSVYDMVILDTSPLLSVVDTRCLLPLVDGVVICARSYQTTRDQAHATRDALDQAGGRPAGLVVTGVRLGDDDYYSYYNRYVQAPPGPAA